MLSERREVVVVGGGPAGCAAALHLAVAGRDVLLLERARVPRPKACGDCLSPQASRLLARLGVLPHIDALEPARLAGWRIVAPAGAELRAYFSDVAGGDALVASGLALRRHRLDHVLIAAAAAAGVEVRTGVQVTDVVPGAHGDARVVARTTDGVGHIRARLVVAADGLRSVVARRIGARQRRPRVRKLSLTAHVRGVRGVTALGEMHLADRSCIGLAPVDAALQSCNLTLVVDAREGAGIASAQGGGEAPDDGAHRGRDNAPHNDDAQHARITQFVRGALRRFPALSGRLDDMELLEEPGRGLVWLASGPFDFPVRHVVADGVALAGDAGGYFDPFTGQGIHQALATGELVARCALDVLARGGPVTAARLAPYAAAHAALTSGPHRVQRWIDAVLARPRPADAAIRLLARSAPLRDTLLAVTGDLLPVRALLDPRRAAAAIHSLARSA